MKQKNLAFFVTRYGDFQSQLVREQSTHARETKEKGALSSQRSSRAAFFADGGGVNIRLGYMEGFCVFIFAWVRETLERSAATRSASESPPQSLCSFSRSSLKF